MTSINNYNFESYLLYQVYGRFIEDSLDYLSKLRPSTENNQKRADLFRLIYKNGSIGFDGVELSGNEAIKLLESEFNNKKNTPNISKLDHLKNQRNLAVLKDTFNINIEIG